MNLVDKYTIDVKVEQKFVPITTNESAREFAVSDIRKS